MSDPSQLPRQPPTLPTAVVVGDVGSLLADAAEVSIRWLGTERQTGGAVAA